MKKISSFISMVSIFNVLIMAGLALFLWGSGRLDRAKAQTISDILRQSGTPVGFREKVYDLLSPPPATQPGPATTTTAPSLMADLMETDEPPLASAQDRIDFVRRVREEERLRLESAAQDLRKQHDLLLALQASVEADRKKLDADKAELEKRTAAASAKKDDDGFGKTMALFQELKPAQIKDFLAGMGPEEAARYLTAMEPDRAAKIMGEFKSADEKAFLQGVLDRMRGASTASGTGAASVDPAQGAAPVKAPISLPVKAGL